MARLGANGDSKRLRDLLEGVTDKAAKLQGRSLQRWSAETHVRAEGDSVHVDLHDLDLSLTEELVSIVLGQSAELWTRRIRFLCGSDDATLDGEKLRPWLLGSLNTFTREDANDWVVSNRDGRPYIDLKKQAPDPQDPPTFETGRLRMPRRRSTRDALPEELAGEEERVEDAPLSKPGRDRRADITSIALVLGLSVPVLIAYYLVLVAVVDALGPLRGGLAAMVLIVLYGAMQIGIMLLVRQLTQPNRIHRCRNCNTVNRIIPLTRRFDLQCGKCQNPLYGAWPITEIEGVHCPHCKTLNQVEGVQLIAGVPACHKCGKNIAVNAAINNG